MIKKFQQTPSDYESLISKAKAMTEKSYAPYSHFNVGAAVLLSDGTVITGANQENAAFGECVCAERVALLYATANHPRIAPIAIAIAARTADGFTETSVTPCGSCRQVLNEMELRFKNDIKIIMYGAKEVTIADCVKDLLPLTFGENISDL